MTTPVPSTSDPWPAANAGLLTRGLSAAAGGLCDPNMEQDMSSATKQRGDNVEPVEEKARLPSSDCSTPRYAYLGLLSCFLWQCTADVTGSKILTLNIFHFLRDFSKHASLTWKTPSLSSFRFNDWWIKPIPAFTGQVSTPDGSQDDRVCLVFLDKAEVHHASVFEVVVICMTGQSLRHEHLLCVNFVAKGWE